MGNTQASKVKSNPDTNIDTGRTDHENNSKYNLFSPEISTPRLFVKMENNMKRITLRYRTNGTETIKIEGFSLKSDVSNQLIEFGRKLHKFSCGVDTEYDEPVLTLFLNNLISSIFCSGHVEISIGRKVNPSFVMKDEVENPIVIEDLEASSNGLLSKSSMPASDHSERVAQNSKTIEMIEKSMNDLLLKLNEIPDENTEIKTTPQLVLTDPKERDRIHSKDNEFDKVISLLADKFGNTLSTEKCCEVSQSSLPQQSNGSRVSELKSGTVKPGRLTGGILLSAYGSAKNLARKPWRLETRKRKWAKRNSSQLAGESSIYKKDKIRSRKKSDHVYEEVAPSNQFCITSTQKGSDSNDEALLSDFSDFDSDDYPSLSSTSSDEGQIKHLNVVEGKTLRETVSPAFGGKKLVISTWEKI